MGTNIHRITLLFCITTLLFFTNCSDSSTGINGKTLAGPYLVIKVDGKSVPFETESPLQEDNCHGINNGGWLDLKENGTFQMEVFVTDIICDGNLRRSSARTVRGTYEISDGEIFFKAQKDDPSAPFTGTYYDAGTNIGVTVTIDSAYYIFFPMEVKF